jgi:hypothetical protein
MRRIQTYILRLLVDVDDPHAVRGALRGVADGEEYPFAHAQALVDLLRRLGDDQAPTSEVPDEDHFGDSTTPVAEDRRNDGEARSPVGNE